MDNSQWAATDIRCRMSCRCIAMYKLTYAYKESFGKIDDSCAAVVLTRRKSTAECLFSWFDGDEAMANLPLTKLLVQLQDTIANRYCRSCPTVRHMRSRIAIAIMSRNGVQVHGYFRRGGFGAGGLHEAVFEPGHTHSSR